MASEIQRGWLWWAPSFGGWLGDAVCGQVFMALGLQGPPVWSWQFSSCNRYLHSLWCCAGGGRWRRRGAACEPHSSQAGWDLLSSSSSRFLGCKQHNPPLSSPLSSVPLKPPTMLKALWASRCPHERSDLWIHPPHTHTHNHPGPRKGLCDRPLGVQNLQSGSYTRFVES